MVESTGQACALCLFLLSWLEKMGFGPIWCWWSFSRQKCPSWSSKLQRNVILLFFFFLSPSLTFSLSFKFQPLLGGCFFGWVGGYLRNQIIKLKPKYYPILLKTWKISLEHQIHHWHPQVERCNKTNYSSNTKREGRIWEKVSKTLIHRITTHKKRLKTTTSIHPNIKNRYRSSKHYEYLSVLRHAIRTLLDSME